MDKFDYHFRLLMAINYPKNTGTGLNKKWFYNISDIQRHSDCVNDFVNPLINHLISKR